jgi:hypothetical protein
LYTLPHPDTRSARDLGKLVSVHGTSAAYLQRAAIVVVMAFVFFLVTLILYNLWGDIVYLLMAAAFLILHPFTLVGWWMQKRNVVRLYENGVEFRKFNATWDEISRVEAKTDTGVRITKIGGETVTLGRSVSEIGKVARVIKAHLPA